MTDNTKDGVTPMQPPIIQGSNPQGSAPEVGTEETQTPATAKVEETTNHTITTDDSLKIENERLEKERKTLARISSDQGRKTKQAQLAALDAIADLSDEKAESFLESHPELKDAFEEKYPDRFKQVIAEETPQVTPEPPLINKIGLDEDIAVAKVLARTAKAAQEQEQESSSLQFAVNNGLNREEQQSLKKIASALVKADVNTSFKDAMSLVYQNKFGKEPTLTPPSISSSTGTVDPTPSQEQIDWWANNVSTSITGDRAQSVQKGADAFYKSMTKGTR